MSMWMAKSIDRCLIMSPPIGDQRVPGGAYEKNAETVSLSTSMTSALVASIAQSTRPYEVPQNNSLALHRPKVRHVPRPPRRGRSPACVESVSEWRTSSRLWISPQSSTTLRVTDSSGVPSLEFYRTDDDLQDRHTPRNALPANFYNVPPGAKHLPLVIMVLAFCDELSAGSVSVVARVDELGADSGYPWRSADGTAWLLSLGFLALGEKRIFHLGRLLYAFRAFIGLRHHG